MYRAIESPKLSLRVTFKMWEMQISANAFLSSLLMIEQRYAAPPRYRELTCHGDIADNL